MIAYDSGCCFRGSTLGTLPRVLWELNTTCNLNCSWCHARPHDSKGISTTEVEEGLALIKKWGIRGVIFSGGEPFLRPDILHLLKFAASLDMDVDVCTNATLIDEHAAQVLSGVLSEISVSIDSANPLIHNKLRGAPNAWERAVAGISQLKQSGLEVHSISVVCRETFAGIEETIAFLENVGINSLTLLGMIKFSDNESFSPITLPQTEQIQENLKKWRKTFKHITINTKRVIHQESVDFCGAGDKIWGIDTAGNLLPCLLLKGETESCPIQSLKDMSSWNEITQKLFKTPAVCFQ